MSRKSLIPLVERKKSYYQRQKESGYLFRNREKIKQYKASHYQRNKEKWQRTKFAQYGLTLERYNELVKEQQGRCALCGTPAELDRDGVLHVDHDHTTGIVRGLLCVHCNLGIGHLRDSPSLMRLAADYVEQALDRKVGAKK